VPDDSLAELLADARNRASDPPSLDEVVEDAGRQRIAAFYLYSALVAAVIGPGDLAPARWPHELAEPIRRLDLTRFTPRTGRGLDAQLTPAEQAMRRSPDRQFKFAQLLVDLINHGAFGPLCGDADRVRLARPVDGQRLDLELIQGQRVVGTCAVKDHWELVAQHLAGMPLHSQLAGTASAPGTVQRAARQLEETGIAHAVSAGVTLAVSIHPLGAAAGLGTRLVRARIQAGLDQADALGRLGEELRTLRAEADCELADLRTGTSAEAASSAPGHSRERSARPGSGSGGNAPEEEKRD
jgi:hypothetical protein